MTKHLSEWKPLSELNTVTDNYSNLKNTKKYIFKQKIPYEVKSEGDKILWSLNDNLNYLYVEEPKNSQLNLVLLITIITENFIVGLE